MFCKVIALKLDALQLINLVNWETTSLRLYTREVIRNIVLPPGSFQNPVTSCVNLPQNSPSGSYWIQNPNTGNATLQYCDNSTRCSCSAGVWMRVANLDMTDPNQQCPSGFRDVTFPRCSCGRPFSTRCISTTFPVNGVEYSRVCGRIIGYQYGSPNAFMISDGSNPRQCLCWKSQSHSW